MEEIPQNSEEFNAMREMEKMEAINYALMQVGELRDRANSMGANDSELPELNAIMDRLRNKEIDPNEAVRRANEIVESKQDYH